jgi:hypothetical protein
MAILSGDGYAEFTVTQDNVYWMAGLSHGDSNSHYTDLDYAIYVHGNGYAYYWENTTGVHYLGPYTAGTTFRVEIQGSEVLYKMNGSVMAQHATTPAYPLLVDSSIYTPNASISNAVISGNLVPSSVVVFWTNLINTSDGGGTTTLTKTGVNDKWDAGGSSTLAIESGDGYAEFVVNQENIYWMAGLSNGDSNASYQDIDYAVYFCGNGYAYVYDDAGKFFLGSYTIGTTVRIEIQGSNVIYKIDGEVMAQHATTPRYPLLLDSSIRTPGTAISNASISGKLVDARKIQNVMWTNKVNVSDGGGTSTLTKTGSNELWDAGASSTKAIQAGDGYAEFTVAADNVYWMAGLSHVDTDTSFQEINYAVYFCGNGYMYAYDSSGKYFLGPYSAGTRVRVEIEGSNVIYKVNMNIVIQHATTPTYPLLLDTAIYTPGAVISNAVIAGDLL